MAITHFGMGGWCTRTVGSSGLKLKAKLGHISPAAMRRAKSFIDLAVGATRRTTVCLGGAMSALGQKRTYAVQNGMSALHPQADMCSALADGRFGPIADIEQRSDLISFQSSIRRFGLLFPLRARVCAPMRRVTRS